MSYYGWKPYVSVAARRQKAAKAAAKAAKAGAAWSPVAAHRGAIARTFWGKSWCENLERYSDYANRLPRGRTYVRSGAVIDLQISAGKVSAQVMGSSLYTVAMSVTAVPQKQWQALCKDCSGSIDSLVEILQGRLSAAVMAHLSKPGTGLFPAPKEITFSCSCPDWASMCKHVAAVLYGVGARLDQQPELLFGLRHVDAKDLIAEAGSGLQKPGLRPKSGKVLEDVSLAEVFGIEMTEAQAKTVAKTRKPVAAKVLAKNMVARKVGANKIAAKKAAAKKLAAKKVQAGKATPLLASATRKPRVPSKTKPARKSATKTRAAR